ncbi:hypothetical protein SISSUDRAFT_570777 [Sistotremastrum suecicum HHB10207 ss-3]|uniref:Uncharacterized protein n=1 Tax=Sistotremastrum suecicum HHB10207 ss-3 TaxID=1314776 RepID=A0A166EQZ5_9AGAM|nr:hypothetical protein SISSUDRAFT_570777 [Sistotremastrum suecicum HHB10207 ss-3]
MTGQTSTEMQSVADEANGGGVAANPVDGNEVVVDKPAEAKDTIEEMESVNGKDESDDEVALGSASDHEDLGEWEATEAFPDELGSTFHPSAPPFTITSGSTTISHAPPPLPVPSQPSASQLQGKAKGKDKGKRRRQEARRSPSPAVPIDPAIHVDSSSPESLADRWPSSSIVVIDPFIMSKNVTRGENELVLSKFISECRRAVVCLDELGGSFESLLGDGSPIRIGNGESRASRKAKERKAAKEAGAKDKDAAKEKKDKGKGKGKEQENETKEKSSSNSAQPQPVSAPAPAPVHSEPGPSQRKAKEDHSDQSRTELNQWPDTRAQSSGRVRAQEATSSTTIPRNFAGLVSRALADIGAGGVPVRGPVLGRWVPPSQRPPVRRPNSDAPVSTTNTKSVSGVSSGTATRNRRRRRRVVRGDAAAANSDVQSHPGPETQGV